MTRMPTRYAAFSCRYAPLPLIHAAGLVPYRVLPLTTASDQAGTILHDNICAHVKLLLDRALADDLPALTGVIFVDSCDAMRRVADGWRRARPEDQVFALDLPVGSADSDVAYFARELARLRQELGEWSGSAVTDQAIRASCELYSRLAACFDRLASFAAQGQLEGGRAHLQELTNRSVTSSPAEMVVELEGLAGDCEQKPPAVDGVPVLLFGNLFADPTAWELLATCGARIVDEDLCTGSRQLIRFALDDGDELTQIARQLLRDCPCARAVEAGLPGRLGQLVVDRARACGARGVIAHSMKFCDLYLVRLPAVREALKQAGLPLLVLEGDCTLRSLGQHRTRIEAFIEMLEP